MHTWTTDLDSYAVRRIVQSAVFAADTVLLPENAAIDPATPPNERRFIERQLSWLRDLQAVELWALEDDHRGAPLVPGAATTVLSVDEYSTLYERAIDSLIAQRRDFLGDQRALHFDGMTEIILGKHATIHSELSNRLGAQAILHDRASASGYGQFLTHLEQAALFHGVVDEIVARLGLPDVTEFPDDVLASARANLRPFRERVSTLLAQEGVVAGPLGEQSLKESVAKHVVAEYQILREHARDLPPARRGVWRLTRFVRRQHGRSEPLQLLLELDRRRPSSDDT
jgi:hypothetical protein